MKFMVEISARHCHISQKDFEAIYGEGKTLTPMKELSQPGQYAAEEKVTLETEKGSMTFRILGPFRKETQFEVSATEARGLGIKPPIRESGDLAGTPGGTVSGPAGKTTIDHGVIIAKRHIHMEPADAEALAVSDQEIVNVKIKTDARTLVYGDVVVRVNKNYKLAMHIDTDEGNAAGIITDVTGEIVKL